MAAESTNPANAGSITIVGLGSGDENQLTLGVWRTLQAAKHLFLRTENHPVTRFLREEGVRYESFDHIYESTESFEETYETIVAKLLELAEEQAEPIVYAVPGHPMVAEDTVRRLREMADAHSIEIKLLGGESFLDEAFLRLGFDPIEGFQLLDATLLRPEVIRPDTHTLIAQVYDRLTASDVKLALMEVYPDEYPVIAAHSLGVAGEERIVTLPLYELDRTDDYGNLSLIWLPRSEDDRLQSRRFERLHEIVSILRSPDGCPWDREQTHRSIRKNLIEETYEVLETIDDDDPEAMCEELGDVLLQVMLHAQIEEEEGTFSVWDVVNGLNQKLIRRHPHVFGDRSADNAEEALTTWQEMKSEEKRVKGTLNERSSILTGIPRDLPALMYAYTLQKKAAAVGFDWDRIEDVLEKVEEEIQEVRQLLDTAGIMKTEEGKEALRGELGDLFFAVVNAARFLKVDPEEALARTNRKFIQRFRHIEMRLEEAGKSFSESNLAEMDSWWNEAKDIR